MKRGVGRQKAALGFIWAGKIGTRHGVETLLEPGGGTQEFGTAPNWGAGKNLRTLLLK